MHIAILFRLPLELEQARSELDEIGSLPVTVMAEGRLLEALAQADVTVPTGLEWARCGWSAPWFPMLPETEIDRQLARESSAMAAIGVEPGPLYVGGPWLPPLVSSFVRNSVSAIMLPSTTLKRTGTGVVAHLDNVLPVVGVSPLNIELPDATSSQVLDDLMVVHCETSDDVLDAVGRFSTRPGYAISHVGSHFFDHAASGRVHPFSNDWEEDIRTPEQMIHHRKLIRLVTRLPDRISDSTERAILIAEAGAPFEGVAPIAHEALVEARRAIDDERRRGQDWGKVTRLDWNADGRDEVHVELPDLSFVVVPHESARLATIDMKQPNWPVSALPSEPGWDLVRFVTDLEEDVPLHLDFEVESVVETKTGDVTMAMQASCGAGSLLLTVDAGAGRLSLKYETVGMPSGWLGPELRLTLPDTRSRTDGSPWRDVDAPTVTSGHRIRLDGHDRRASIETLSPIRCYLRPTDDGAVAWPHWATVPDGVYQLTIDLNW